MLRGGVGEGRLDGQTEVEMISLFFNNLNTLGIKAQGLEAIIIGRVNYFVTTFINAPFIPCLGITYSKIGV